MTTETTARRALAAAMAMLLMAALAVVAVRSGTSGRRALKTTGHSNDSLPNEGVVQPNQGNDPTTTDAAAMVTSTDGTVAQTARQGAGKSGSKSGSGVGSTSSTAGHGSGPGKGGGASANWPMFHGSAQHSGLSTATGPSSANVAWTYAPGDAFRETRSGPVVGSNGTIYEARGSDGNPSCQAPAAGAGCGAAVDALSPNGARLWEWVDSTENIVRTTPAVAPDGTVYVTFDGPTAHPGDLVALTASGKTKWKVTGHLFYGPPTIGPDGTLYLQDTDSAVYALRAADGHILWQFGGSAGTIGVRGTPALSPDGSTIYATSGGGAVYALSTSGQLRWQASITGPSSGDIPNGPAVGPDGTVYVATGGSSGNTPGDIDAFSSGGALKWHYTADGSFETTPAVAPNGLVVAGDDMGDVVAIAPNGTLAWSYHAPGTVGTDGFYDSSAAIGADGTVYIQNGASTVFALRDGNPIWTASGASDASPALADNGVLYVSGFGGLQAFQP